MLAAVACQCGSSDTLIRSRLAKFHAPQASTIQIPKGREKSHVAINALPPFPEVNNIRAQVEAHTKWAIVIGYNENGMKWVDLANGQYIKNDVELELLVEHFA